MRQAKDMTTDKLSPGSKGPWVQWRQCPNCLAPINASSKFCSECGTRIEDFISSKEISPEPISLAEDATLHPLKRRAPKSTPFHVADLFPHRKVSEQIREMYFDLGVALLDRQEYSKAAEVFQNALNSQGAVPENAGILLYQAYACEMASDHEYAIHAYLEALLQAPEYIKAVLLHVHELLTPDIVLTQSRWITKEWAMRIVETQCDPASRIHVALFIGRVNLYLAKYAQALKQFKEAMQLDPVEASAMAEVLLEPEMLPPALAASAKDGNADYCLAQLYLVIGHPKEALQKVNGALERGLSDTGSYTEAEAMQFKAQLLEEAGKRTEAAMWFYEAGCRFSWRNEFQTAIVLLKKTTVLNPSYVLTYWYLSNALRMSSYTPYESPYLNKEKIDESLSIWEKGRRIRLPGAADSWAYVVHASINQSQAVLSTNMSQRRNLLWEAVTYIERALLLYQKDAYRWAFLGRFHRVLNNETSALAATKKALDYDEEDTTALDERAAILTNVGNFPDAEEKIDKRRELEPSVWADGVKACILVHTNRAQEALELVNELIGTNPQELSYRGLRALCYQELNQLSSAVEDYQFIWDHRNPTDMNNQSTFGWAAYKLGMIDEAIEIFSKLRDDPAQERSSVYWSLGLFYLTKGDLDSGERNLARGTELAINKRQLNDIISIDFREIEKASSSWPHDAQVREVLGRMRKKISIREDQLSREDTVEEEIKRVIGDLQFLSQRETENWAWIGAHAGLARFYLENKRWSEAAAVYQLLQQYPEQFPEARNGLEVISDALRVEGDASH